MKRKPLYFIAIQIYLCLFISNMSAQQNTLKNDSFQYFSEQFADMKILRYQIPAFESLSLKQKELVYYLSQAALAGRDITWDQNGKYNLAIRKLLEAIYTTYKGDRNVDDFKKMEVYLKRLWFSNGIYHHNSTDKIMPEFSKDYFFQIVKESDQKLFPKMKGLDIQQMLELLSKVMFDPAFLPKGVEQDPSKDIVANSAHNFYEGVSQQEAEEFYKKLKKSDNQQPISYGLNSKLVKTDKGIEEKIWYAGGMYANAIKSIVGWLEKAETVAENKQQQETIKSLIEYYKTGNLETFEKYNVQWVKDNESHVDFVNGFIEVYGDPMGLKATWESVVNFKDIEATKRTEIISFNAQWFEDHSPVETRFKKEKVQGVSAKVITVAQLGGDCHPTTPIGINLPNADWIRRDHGSKSVTLENITYAYDRAAVKSGALEEFANDEDEIKLIRENSYLAGNMHTDLHECLGHGSGKMLPGVTSDDLKNYHSPIEEARADLFALYYIMDPKMVELGLIPSLDVAKAEYISYIRNGYMTQLMRVELGKDIQQAHMRDRQMIANWCIEHGKTDNVIEIYKRDNKTMVRVNDFEKLRSLFGKLLAEIQRIKSTGDYEAARNIIETYGVKVNEELHTEIIERYKKLNIAPFSGFINPKLVPVMSGNKIIDVKVEYPDNYAWQMLEYSKEHSLLGVEN